MIVIESFDAIMAMALSFESLSVYNQFQSTRLFFGPDVPKTAAESKVQAKVHSTYRNRLHLA